MRVSRPLIGLLVATVAFFGVWLAALKPSGSGSGDSPHGVGQFNSAIAAAHNAVATSNAASVVHGGTLPTASKPSPAAPGAEKPAPVVAAAHTRTAPARAHTFTAAGTPQSRQQSVARALQTHRVVALLFYNPPGADDRAVRAELAAVPGHGGRVLKLAVPLTELTRYSVVTSQVPVEGSPTLVVIDRRAQAQTVVGFADRFEIAQLVADALAS